MVRLTAEERRWLNTISNDAEPLQLVIVGRRGEYTVLIEDLEELMHTNSMHPVRLMSLINTHVREVQAEEGGEHANGNGPTDSE